MLDTEIRKLTGDLLTANLEGLAEVLQASVAAGAAVGFVLPMTIEDSRAFWRETVFPLVRQEGRSLFAAFEDERLVGTVQLHVDLPPNQPHRCEVTKLVVHPEFRQRGIARRLMAALEAEARTLDRHLITLDTKTGDKAEPLYRSLGYRAAGIIPGFALNADGGDFHATIYMVSG